MPLVFYTNREIPTGQVIDTHGFCEENRIQLESLPPEHSEVENLLETMRRVAIPIMRESRPLGLPQRICSITAIPWPESEENPEDFAGFMKRETLKPMPDPPPLEDYDFCYYVTIRKRTRTAFVDERWVKELVARWGELKGTQESRMMAMEYWTGGIMAVTLVPYIILLEGPVMVHSICRSRLALAGRMVDPSGFFGFFGAQY